MTIVLAGCAVGWGVGLVIFCGFHATWTIGVTGGPNHGEHPFLVNLIHLGVAAFWATKGWTSAPRWIYLGLLGVGVLIGIAVINLRVYEHPKPVWAARVAMIALYLGLLGVLFWGRGPVN
jgi:hypothetical protein